MLFSWIEDKDVICGAKGIASLGIVEWVSGEIDEEVREAVRFC